MKTQASRVLLALIATLLIYLVCFSLFSCTTTDEVLPTCDWVKATQNGDRMTIEIESRVSEVTMCRELPTRTSCTTIKSVYFGCISMEVFPSEVITFDNMCIITAR